MRYLIIEDEYHAAKRLKTLVQKLEQGGKCLAVIDSVEDAVTWLRENPMPDLVFMDIQLADGLSFDIFNNIDVQTPVIFTTAFNEYALRAFKTNSIDYLLKPVDEGELAAALKKFENLYGQTLKNFNPELIRLLSEQVTGPEFVKRFLIKQSASISYIPVEDVAWFYSEDGLTFLMTIDRKKHHIDYTLEQLTDLLDPKIFFRINRKHLLHVQSVEKAAPYFNNRLKITLKPATDQEVVVSRERVKGFKEWLGS